MLRLPIEEASAKIRTGEPVDDEEDYTMNVWAGVLPIALSPGDPIADKRLPSDTPIPDYMFHYKRS